MKIIDRKYLCNFITQRDQKRMKFLCLVLNFQKILKFLRLILNFWPQLYCGRPTAECHLTSETLVASLYEVVGSIISKFAEI